MTDAEPWTDEERDPPPEPDPYRAPPGTCLHGRLPELCPACGGD